SLGDIALQPPLKQIQASWKFARARFDEYDFYFLIGNWAHYAGARHHPNVYYCLTPTRSFYDQRREMLARLRPPVQWVARAWSSSHARFERRSIRRCDPERVKRGGPASRPGLPMSRLSDNGGRRRLRHRPRRIHGGREVRLGPGRGRVARDDRSREDGVLVSAQSGALRPRDADDRRVGLARDEGRLYGSRSIVR